MEYPITPLPDQLKALPELLFITAMGMHLFLNFWFSFLRANKTFSGTDYPSGRKTVNSSLFFSFESYLPIITSRFPESFQVLLDYDLSTAIQVLGCLFNDAYFKWRHWTGFRIPGHGYHRAGQRMNSRISLTSRLVQLNHSTAKMKMAPLKAILPG